MEEQIEFLEEAGRILTDALRDEIINEGLLNSGELARSPRFEVKLYNGNPQLFVYIEDYGFYQDSGVNGTERSVPESGESFQGPGRFRSKVIGGPLPYPVRFVIARDGIKPRPFINKAYDTAIRWMDKNIDKPTESMIDASIDNIFSQNGAVVS